MPALDQSAENDLLAPGDGSDPLPSATGVLFRSIYGSTLLSFRDTTMRQTQDNGRTDRRRQASHILTRASKS